MPQEFEIDVVKPVSTPVETGIKLVKSKDIDKLMDQKTYQLAVECLLYLSTKARPTISSAVGSVVFLLSSKLSQILWTAIEQIMMYFNGISLINMVTKCCHEERDI